jgi:acetyltransferase-like isoleucine patch superfamily enzyme
MNVGKYTYGIPNVRFSNNYSTLNIGNFCSIGGNVEIYLGGEHRTDYVTTYPFGYLHKNVFNLNREYEEKFTKGNVVIGNDVWIGDNVTIMSGINIGDGSVIANSSHVVKDVLPFSVVGGNPAKLIKHRFSEKQIEDLLQIKWWYWDDDKINKHVELLHDTNIDNFIKSAFEM